MFPLTTIRRHKMFEIMIGIVLAAFAAGGIWAFVFSKKVKENGIERAARRF